MKNKVVNKPVIIVIIILAILSVLGLFQFEAQVFDVFGLITFSCLAIAGGWMLATKKETPNWVAWIILGIGILGIIVDGGITLKAVLK